MSYKKSTQYFLLLSIVLMSILPIANTLIFLVFSKNNQTLLDLDKKQLFSTDNIESYVNYSAYKQFNISLVNNKVIIGKDGFLFLGNDSSRVLDKTKGVFRPSKKEIELWSDKLKDLQDWYENQGIKFVIVIAPNKHSIYPEKLPHWMEYHGKTITDDIVEQSNAKGINLLDLRPILLSKKEDEPLYFKTDTHWNQRGAGFAFEAIIAYLNRKHNINIIIPNYHFEQTHQGAGDLANFLKISAILDKNYEKSYSYRFDKQSKICKGDIDREEGNLSQCQEVENQEMHINDRPLYMINNTIQKHKLLLICDSFGIAPSVLYNNSFNTIYKWHFNHLHGEKLKRFVNQTQPNIVIYQIVERDFYNNHIVTPISNISSIAVSHLALKEKIFTLSHHPYTQNDQFSLRFDKGVVELNTTKHDPIITLNQTQVNSSNVVLSYEIDSPLDTTFQIFYKETKTSHCNQKDSYRVAIKKGNNRFNLLIPSRYINNTLRVDLVSSIGSYTIKKFETYGMNSYGEQK